MIMDIAGEKVRGIDNQMNFMIGQGTRSEHHQSILLLITIQCLPIIRDNWCIA